MIIMIIIVISISMILILILILLINIVVITVIVVIITIMIIVSIIIIVGLSNGAAGLTRAARLERRESRVQVGRPEMAGWPRWRPLGSGFRVLALGFRV